MIYDVSSVPFGKMNQLKEKNYMERHIISFILSPGDEISKVFPASISDVIFSFPFGNL